ncbi:MAG: DMT family transporter [Armatimonadota bacterium]
MAIGAREPHTVRRGFGLGDLFVLLTVILWGASFTVIKAAYDEFTPLAFAAVRFVLASLGLLLILVILRQPLSIARRDLLRVAAVGAFHVGLYQIFFSVGLRFTTASNSILIINTAPVMTAVLVWFTKAERITWRQTLGLFLAAAGVLMLVEASGSVSAGHLKGDLITLLAAASYAVTPIIVLPLYKRYTTLPVKAVGMVCGTVLLVAVGLPELTRQSWTVSAAAWGQLAYAALGAGSLGYLFWYEGIRRIGPTRVAAYSYLMPPFGVLLAVRVLHEPFGPLHLLAAVVTITGVALARWPAAQRKTDASRLSAATSSR